MLDTVLSILVLAAIALLIGAYLLWKKGGQPRQIILMLILVMVIVVNLAIWLVPDPSGNAPLKQAETVGAN